MKNLIIISAISNACAIIGTVFLYTSFFTGFWLKVYKTQKLDENAEEAEGVAVHKIESDHGLWDNGLQDLNCEVTPFGICMYTRASLFAGMVLVVPGLLFSILSVAIVASGGRIETSGTLARAGGIVMVLINIGVFIGVLIFTIQHTSCITSCPPTYAFYPSYPEELSFGWSFLLAWISLAFFIPTTVLLFLFAHFVEKRYKVSFSPNRIPTRTTPVNSQPQGVSIELVRVNQDAIDQNDLNTTTEARRDLNTMEREDRRV